MATGSSRNSAAKNPTTPPPETELLNVVVEREGRNVSTKWGLHPQLKEHLSPEEWRELTDIMGKVTSLVGNRFSQVLADSETKQTGTA